MQRREGDPLELVLVGGGHAHVQVLRRFAMAPEPGVHLTLVVDAAEAVYSGMVPGVVAGDHPLADATIDCVPLARRARARVVLAEARRIEPDARRIVVGGRPPLRYDVASLNVGGSVAGLELPGVREHALATRPIGAFVSALEARIQALPAAGPVSVAVVGGGAAGSELALCLEARLRREGHAPEVTLVASESALRPALARAVERELARRGIAVVRGLRAVRVGEDGVELEDGRHVPARLVLWATGAAPPQLLRDSPLPADPAGFVRVDDRLRVLGRHDLFAAGDCASFTAVPLAKAGVYAVRQGPLLADNLRRALADRPLRRFAPQRDFLVLINAGAGRAVGGRGHLGVAGRGVFHLKGWIDRRFMRRFQVLDVAGRPSPHFPSPESMGMEEMPCGGCAAKLGPDPLAAALARLPAPPADARVVAGVAAADDVAVLRGAGGGTLLATLDGFRAFTDDPYLVGRVAAANALNDVLAKGGAPTAVLAWVGVPEAGAGGGEELLYQTLCGVRDTLDPLGASLVGGHTTTAEELVVGLAVLGEPAEGAAPVRNAGARVGDALILTRPLGSGVLLAADMRGLASGRHVQALHALLQRPSSAAAVLLAQRASAATDVSGFGLARHAAEMARASGVSATLALDALPVLDGALDLLAHGVRSSFHPSNRSGAPVDATRVGDDPRAELCFDPQTAGGILLAVGAERVEAALAALHAAGETRAVRVGQVAEPRGDGVSVTLLPS